MEAKAYKSNRKPKRLDSIQNEPAEPTTSIPTQRKYKRQKKDCVQQAEIAAMSKCPWTFSIDSTRSTRSEKKSTKKTSSASFSYNEELNICAINQPSSCVSLDLSLTLPLEKSKLMTINEAFELLRLNIPTFPYERRLSKIDTLHLAIAYINLLECVIESQMSLYDYIQMTLGNLFSCASNSIVSSQFVKPLWLTSGNYLEFD
jgi:hypothetical protein